MPALKTGELRHRIRIERRVPERDSSGDVIQDPATGLVSYIWVEVATVYAKITALSVREFIQSAAVQSQVTARITIRRRDDLDASVRLVHMVNGQRGEVYNPQGFLPDPESGLEYFTAPCTQGVGVGQ